MNHRRQFLVRAVSGLLGYACVKDSMAWPPDGKTPKTSTPLQPAPVDTSSGLSRLSGGCTLSSFAELGSGLQLLPSSGDYNIDAAFQRESMGIINTLPVRPWGYFLNDMAGANAFAMPDSMNPSGPDGTTAFGVTLLGQELRRDGGIGFSIPAILAHEIAHIYQFKMGFNPGNPAMELHADFLAGWVLSVRGKYLVTDVRPALESFFEKGDYEFNSPQHHGTPEQRLEAVMSGLMCGASDADEAFRLATRHVRA